MINRRFSATDREALAEELAAAPPEMQEEVEMIYDEAALNGSQGAILVGGIVALLGAFRLPKEKLKPESEGVIRETVRNTTVAKLQFEMEDLPPSPRLR